MSKLFWHLLKGHAFLLSPPVPLPVTIPAHQHYDKSDLTIPHAALHISCTEETKNKLNAKK